MAVFIEQLTKKDNTITIHFSEDKHNPADPLIDDNAGKLLVAQYAWDGNSYPGKGGCDPREWCR